MEMRLFWVTDQVQRSFFNVRWHPGQENLADYFTKHFDAKHHREVQTWYLHEYNSPRFLPRAIEPSALRGYVGTLPNSYTKSSPLPRVNPKVRVNPRLKLSHKMAQRESLMYRAQLALYTLAAIQSQLTQHMHLLANSITMAQSWRHN